MIPPRVSIVTTVYDRVECLDRCLRATEKLQGVEWEQIVVADAPDPAVRLALDAVAQPHTRVRFLVLPERHNDWGMTPAYVGLTHSVGEFVCFLSDDNAYLPGHFPPLVAELDRDPGLAFAYSSARYDNRLILNTYPPRGGRIDLGQPLFRRQTVLEAFPSRFPHREFAWDWRVISGVLEGRRCKHVDVASFVFRLARYPQLMETLA